ncbi:MAG TPA: hypothetical protein VEV38_06355 [Candidatus Eremiobacteraceae bacterium]|nr:hypothetical protein [Candidatus Eremiobacteraceae bacterium]
MTLEAVNTIASIGTLLVITATAVAALVQLRHTRGSNQILALTECREVLESDKFMAAMLFVRRRLPVLLDEPAVRKRLDERPIDTELQPINIVGNFFESMGSFVKHDIIDAKVACDLWSGVVLACWEALGPALAIMRRKDGPSLWENFEYLAVLSENYFDKNPNGTYPRGARRIKVVDKYPDDVKR